jgi:NADH-quinone oxidoreductase subunit M
MGAFRANNWVAFFATFGVILSACYALWLYRRVIFGALEKPSLMHIADLTKREFGILVPLVLLTVYFGVYPQPILGLTDAAVSALVKNYDAALAMAKTATLALN